MMEIKNQKKKRKTKEKKQVLSFLQLLNFQLRWLSSVWDNAELDDPCSLIVVQFEAND